MEMPLVPARSLSATPSADHLLGSQASVRSHSASSYAGAKKDARTNHNNGNPWSVSRTLGDMFGWSKDASHVAENEDSEWEVAAEGHGRNVGGWSTAVELSRSGAVDIPSEGPCLSPKPSRTRRRVQSNTRSEHIGSLGKLRQHFLASVDAKDGKGSLTETELFRHIHHNAQELNGPLSQELLELLGEVVRRCFCEINLGMNGATITVNEWIHFIMLRSSAPSHIAAKHVNRRLHYVLGADRGVLNRLHSAFEVADKDDIGMLRQENWKSGLEAVGVRNPIKVDVDEDGYLDYYEYVSHAIGFEPHVVELAMYDLSKGLAQWVPSALLSGHKFKGVWHTGVRVFGKEYWFGGAVLECKFNKVPFGEPAKVAMLGYTLRTREELLEFIRDDLYSVYNPLGYDILRRNCNHFSEEIVQFLLHGRQIPEEVRVQPRWAENASVLQVVQPILGQLLGGMNEGAFGCPGKVVRRVDDMIEEWRCRLMPGDVVLHRARFVDRPWVARIISVSRTGGQRTADIVFFRPLESKLSDRLVASQQLGALWSWQVVRKREVVMRELFPVSGEASCCVAALRAGSTFGNYPHLNVLHRARSQPYRAFCPRGHWLQPTTFMAWFQQVRECGVCSRTTKGERHVCEECNFSMCCNCLNQGVMLGGTGAFADIMTLSLAEELLDDSKWLRFKARCYFFKADDNGSGSLNSLKMRRVADRLCVELGVRPFTDVEILREMAKFCQNPATCALEEPAELDLTCFERFFRTMLFRITLQHRSDRFRL